MTSDKEQRVEAYEALVEELEQIDGVTEVVLDDYTPGTAYSAQIVIRVDADPKPTAMNETLYDIHANLRSVSPRIKNTAKDADNIASGSVRLSSKPEMQYDYNKFSDEQEPAGYNRDFYMLDVNAVI